MRLRHRTVLSGLIVSLALFGLALPAAAAPGPNVWVADAADRVFSSSPRPANPASSVELNAARGEQEAAQIAVRAPAGRDLSMVNVSASPLIGPGGALSGSSVRVRREYDHPNISKVSGDVQQPPNGGNDYYDALVDNTPSRVAANTTQPFYLSVRVPQTQRPGVYRGQVVVTTEAGIRLVPVSLRVYPVTLPPTNQQRFQMNNWFTSAGWDYSGTEKAIPLQYGVPMYSPGWWRVIRNIARNMAAHRNNVIYADFQALLIPRTKIDAAGNYHFDWSIFDRFIQTFIDAGALGSIYTPHLLEPNASGTPNLEILKNVNGTIQRVLATPDTAETNAYLDTLLPALRAHLDERGWTKRFIMSAVDEPSKAGETQAANWFYTKYRQYFPEGNYSTNEAHNHQSPGIDPNLTTVTPVVNLYEHNIGYYQDRRISGNQLWLYTAIGPQGEQMNRFISYHLDKTRLLPWLAWKVGAKGYLHWGWNYWYDSQQPPYTKIDTFTAKQTGDNYLVRPDVQRLDVYDSLRSEAQLDGIEDYELLSQLAERDPLGAREISQRLINDTRSYTREGSKVVAGHKAQLEALSNGTTTPGANFSDSFTKDDSNWVHTMGSWQSGNGRYAQTDSSASNAVSAIREHAWADASVDTSVRIGADRAGTAPGSWAGIVLRNSNATDTESGYLLGIRPDGEVFLYRAGKTLATGHIPNFTPGSELPLHATIQGSTITLSTGAQRTQVLRYTDQQHGFQSGQIALASNELAASFGPIGISANNEY